MADFPTTATLIGMVQAFKVDEANIASQWFPSVDSMSNFYEFDIVEWSRIKGSHRLPDGVAGTVAVRPKTRRKVALPTQREKKMLKESTLRWQDAPGKKMPARALEEIANELRDLDMIVERTHEWVRWQLMTTGSVTLVGDVTDTYNFGIETTATTANAWDTPASSDPIGDIITWKESVEQACGEKATQIIMSTKSQKYLGESTAAQLLLGEQTKDEFARTGRFKMLVDMEVITQDRGYRDTADAFKYYLSTDGAEGDMLIIKTEGSLGVTAQGPPVDSRAPENMIGKFAKSWVTEDPAGRWVLENHVALPGLTKTKYLGAFTLW